MTIRLSSGLRDAVISNWGLGAAMSGGHIQIYTGTQPASADQPPTGTLLARITQDGVPAPGAGGLKMQLGTNAGDLANLGAWVMRGLADGAPGWWRFVAEPADAGQITTELCRIDGAVGESVQGMPSLITPATNLPLAGFIFSLSNQ